MKRIRTKLLSLILSLLLIVSVAAGCSDSGGGSGGGDSDSPSGKKDGPQSLLSGAQSALADFKDVEDVEEKTGEFLENVILATLAHVAERYEGSPLTAMLNTVQSSSFAASFGVSAPESLLQMMEAPDELTEMSLKGTLYADAEKPGAYLDAEVSLNGNKVDGAAYLTEDFLGVGSKAVLGNSKIYGLKPQNLADQFENSVFCDPDSEYYLPIDTASLRQIDEVLEQLEAALEEAENMDLSDIEAETEQFAKDMEEFISGFTADLDYTVEESEVEYLGKDTEGLEITFDYTAEELADTMDETVALLMDSNLYGMIMDYMMGFMTSYAEMSGVSMPEMDFDMDEIKSQVQAAMDEMCAEIRNSGFQLTVTYYIANADKMEKAVVSSYEAVMVKEGSDAELVVSVDYFGEDGDTLALTIGGTDEEGTELEILTLTSTASSGKDYEHTMTYEYLYIGTFSIETTWESSGELHTALNARSSEVIDMGEQGNLPADEISTASITIDGDLDVSKKSFELKDGVLGLSGTGVPEGFEIGFEFGRKDGESLPSVSTVNVLELSEKQVENLITDVTNNLMELSKDFEDFVDIS